MRRDWDAAMHSKSGFGTAFFSTTVNKIKNHYMLMLKMLKWPMFFGFGHITVMEHHRQQILRWNTEHTRYFLIRLIWLPEILTLKMTSFPSGNIFFFPVISSPLVVNSGGRTAWVLQGLALEDWGNLGSWCLLRQLADPPTGWHDFFPSSALLHCSHSICFDVQYQTQGFIPSSEFLSLKFPWRLKNNWQL